MKRLLTWFSLGMGLTLGSGVAYALYISEAMRLVTVGIGAFLLAALTIGGTALIVNRQWINALGAQSHRTTHNHRNLWPAHPAPGIWPRFQPSAPASRRAFYATVTAGAVLGSFYGDGGWHVEEKYHQTNGVIQPS